MNRLKKLEDEISTWHEVSIHPERFGDRQCPFGGAEVGLIHTGGIVDIQFPQNSHG
jgi:hypothetical protein